MYLVKIKGRNFNFNVEIGDNYLDYYFKDYFDEEDDWNYIEHE
jgi:hypothetical protein